MNGAQIYHMSNEDYVKDLIMRGLKSFENRHDHESFIAVHENFKSAADFFSSDEPAIPVTVNIGRKSVMSIRMFCHEFEIPSIETVTMLLCYSLIRD